MSNFSLDADVARRTLNEIVDDVTAISNSSTNFREAFDEAAAESGLAFIDELRKELIVVEDLARKVKASFIQIREMVESYIREFDAFDQL